MNPNKSSYKNYDLMKVLFSHGECIEAKDFNPSSWRSLSVCASCAVKEVCAVSAVVNQFGKAGGDVSGMDVMAGPKRREISDMLRSINGLDDYVKKALASFPPND
jgi:hypothetical protein